MSLSTTSPDTSADTKKKLKTPTPFSGKREDLRKFLQEIKIYLLANGRAYPTDLDKVLFVLSYMSDGDANSWKEEFFDTAEQKAAQDNSTISLGTYNDLINLIVKDFSPYDAPKDAIYEMKELKMGNTSIEEHVSKFKMLVTKSKLSKNDSVVEYFRETLPIPIQQNIMLFQHLPPTSMNGMNGQSNCRTTSCAGKHNFKDTESRRKFHLQCKQEDWERTSKILFWPKPERPKCHGCRLHDHQRKDCSHEKGGMLYIQYNWTPF